jgi:hypothetical protein
MTNYTLTAATRAFVKTGGTLTRGIYDMNDNPAHEYVRAEKQDDARITPQVRWHRDYRW